MICAHSVRVLCITHNSDHVFLSRIKIAQTAQADELLVREEDGNSGYRAAFAVKQIVATISAIHIVTEKRAATLLDGAPPRE